MTDTSGRTIDQNGFSFFELAMSDECLQSRYSGYRRAGHFRKIHLFRHQGANICRHTSVFGKSTSLQGVSKYAVSHFEMRYVVSYLFYNACKISSQNFILWFENSESESCKKWLSPKNM